MAKDPTLADELGIGRPDLDRSFDDGGLVDVNGAPAGVLARLPGFDLASAERVIVARQRHGWLESAPELVVHADISPETVDRASGPAAVPAGVRSARSG